MRGTTMSKNILILHLGALYLLEKRERKKVWLRKQSKWTCVESCTRLWKHKYNLKCSPAIYRPIYIWITKEMENNNCTIFEKYIRFQVLSWDWFTLASSNPKYIQRGVVPTWFTALAESGKSNGRSEHHTSPLQLRSLFFSTGDHH